MSECERVNDEHDAVVISVKYVFDRVAGHLVVGLVRESVCSSSSEGIIYLKCAQKTWLEHKLIHFGMVFVIFIGKSFRPNIFFFFFIIFWVFRECKRLRLQCIAIKTDAVEILASEDDTWCHKIQFSPINLRTVPLDNYQMTRRSLPVSWRMDERAGARSPNSSADWAAGVAAARSYCLPLIS